MAENGFQGELMVLIPTRSASEANKLRLSSGVKFLPRWRFGLVFIVVCLKATRIRRRQFSTPSVRAASPLARVKRICWPEGWHRSATSRTADL